VLRPEQREDRQLEVVRLAPEQLVDAAELGVGEPERPVQRLFRDLRQMFECSRGVGGVGRSPPAGACARLEDRGSTSLGRTFSEIGADR
jgi:hypothetical protein